MKLPPHLSRKDFHSQKQIVFSQVSHFLPNVSDYLGATHRFRTTTDCVDNICGGKENMLVFIRMIPESMTRRDLYRFVDRALPTSWFPLSTKKGRIRSLDLIRIINHQTDSIEYHGLVDIEPAVTAHKAIRRMNGSRLMDRVIEVRKFYHRSKLRDRRSGRSPTDLPRTEDRRMKDRRRCDLSINKVAVSGPLQAGNWPEAPIHLTPNAY